MQQHDLVVAGQHDVDLADVGAVRRRRLERRQGVLGRRDAVAAMAADMDASGFCRERPVAHGAFPSRRIVTTSASWSEIATPAVSTAGITAASVHRSPREKSQSILPKGGGGVPSGRVRCVGASATLQFDQS